MKNTHPDIAHSKRERRNSAEQGLTLPEALITVVIVGILSSISLPAYFKQLTKSCQSAPEQAINQSMGAAQAYYDEYGLPASSWNELSQMSTIMTSSGPANANGLDWIDLPSCDYKLKADQQDNEYTFTATQKGAFTGTNTDGQEEFDPTKNKYNVTGCINLNTGASQIKRGNGIEPINSSLLNCS